MLFYGVFRVCFCTLFGAVTVMLLSQSSSAAAVLKNSCPPNDYLCNYIYQLKLKTHGLISELERRFPDLVNGDQNRDERGDDGLDETEKGNIQGLEEVSMKPIQLSEDISKAPLNNSLNENTTTETSTVLHDDISSTSQTPSKSVTRSDTTPTDQQSTPIPVPDDVEQQGGTSPTQSHHPVDSATPLSTVDPIASSSPDETTDGGSTLGALPGQSTTIPVPRSTSDSDDSVTKVVLHDKTPMKPTASVTNEKLSSGTPSVQLTSNSKPAPVTLGQIDVNGDSQFINKVTEVKATGPLMTDAKHKSSSQVSSMITKSTTDEASGPSTTNPLRVMKVISKEPTPSIDSTEMDHQTTASCVPHKTVLSDRSSTSNFPANTATGSTVKAVTQTDDTFGSGDTPLVSPYDVTEYSTESVLSTITEAEATTPGATSASGSISESTESTPESEGNMTVIEGKWTAHYNTETLSTEIPVTEIVTEEIEVTTLSDITSPVNIRDATTRRALEVSRSIETTQSPTSSQSKQTVGDAIQPEDISFSIPTKSTFETDVTILEDESEVTFVTILDDTTDTYKPTYRHATTDKVPTTETIDETDVTVVEEIFVTAEMDVTTNVYDETGATERYVTTTETVQTSLVSTTTIPTTTQEPTTPTPAPPRDCDEIWQSGSRENGIYTIFPNSRPDGFQVFCDLQDNDGGWTVIQRRVNGSVNFYRSWFDYFLGFGTLQREFYLGNEKIHVLTNQKKYELSIRLWDFEDESRYARYQLFRLGDYMSNYELTVRGYTGNAGNSLGYHSRGRFSTFDRDADGNPAVNCARMYGSGWWFKDCKVKSNLNGLYLRGEHTQRGRGITWKKWKGLEYSLRYSEMRIKPNGL